MAKANRPAITIPTTDGLEGVRCCYVTLANPRAFQPGAKGKYSITMMFDKSNEIEKKALRKLVADLQSVLEEQWKDPATRPRIPIVANTKGSGPKSPVKDGDIAVNDQGVPIKEKNPEYAGHYIVMASCTEDQVPHVVGPRNEQINPSLCRSGWWYKVNCNAYAYKPPNGGGFVTVGLNGVKLVREDEVLGGGRPSADQMFGDVGDDPSMYADDGGAAADPLASVAAEMTQDKPDAWLNGSQESKSTSII